MYRDCETQTSSYTEISLPHPTFTPADPRPLPEAFAQRYGAVTVGERGGIIVRGTRPHAPLEAV